MNIELYCFPGGVSKALTMSYDDGTDHDRRLVELFNRYGIKGTFHLNSDRLGQKGYIAAEEVRALFDGHEVSAHTATHPLLGRLPGERAVAEVFDDRRALERLVGYPVRGMSYPYGSHGTDIVARLPALGLRYARTTRSTGQFAMPDNPLLWDPTCHHKEMIVFGEKLIALTNGKRPHPPALLYVWGHSYEFANDDNWETFEAFGRLMAAHRDSIWFATNIELIDYADAVSRLQFTVDGDAVYNPSAVPVWVRVEGTPVEVAPGELRPLIP